MHYVKSPLSGYLENISAIAIWSRGGRNSSLLGKTTARSHALAAPSAQRCAIGLGAARATLRQGGHA